MSDSDYDAGEDELGLNLEEEMNVTAAGEEGNALEFEDDDAEPEDGLYDAPDTQAGEEGEEIIFEPKLSIVDWCQLHSRGLQLLAVSLLCLLILVIVAGGVVGITVLATSGGSHSSHSSEDENDADSSSEEAVQFEDWPNFRGGMGHSGMAFLNTTKPTNNKWAQTITKYDPTKRLHLGEPALHPEGVYILPYWVEGSNPKISASKVHSGGQEWHYTSHSGVFLSDVQVGSNGVVYANSIARFNDTLSHVVGLDAATGEVVMEYQTEETVGIYSNVAVASKSLIFVIKSQSEAADTFTLQQITFDGELKRTMPVKNCEVSSYFVDPDDMEERASSYGYSPNYGLPITLSEDGKYLFLSCGGLTDARVLMWKTSDLSPHAEYRLPSGANAQRSVSIASISGEILFVMEESAGVLFAFHVTTEEMLYPPVQLRDILTDLDFSHAGYVVADQINENHVFFRARSSGDTSIVASVDCANGSAKWALHVVRDSSWLSPLVVDDNSQFLYVPVDDRILELNSETGEQTGKFKVDMGSSSLVASQVGVYVSEEVSEEGAITLHSIALKSFK